MKRFYILTFLLVGLLQGCETDPLISIPTKPIPVIYSVLDDLDSIHKVYVVKSFGARINPAVSAQIYDSLFFKELDLQVEYLRDNRNSSWTSVNVSKMVGDEKDSGFFSYPLSEYYEFKLKISSLDSIRITAHIPGYEDVIGKIKVVRDDIDINTPKLAQKYLFLSPSSSIKVQWCNAPNQKPHAWSEIDVAFEFIEELESGQRSKWVHIQNSQYFLSPYELFRELSITYEEFIKEVLLQIPADDQVKRTYLGYISIHIMGGDDHMVQYIKYYDGYNDYGSYSYSNIHNGLGLLTSSTHFFKDSMQFDYETRQTLINENRLKKLKISPWTEALTPDQVRGDKRPDQVRGDKHDKN